MEIICFFAGVVFVYVHKTYPVLLLLLTLFFRPRLSYIICFVVAILFALTHAYFVADSNMPAQKVIRNAKLYGWVSTIPARNADRVQFQFTIDKINERPAYAKVLLNCYQNCPCIKASQYWEFVGKIKKTRNLGNPGAFDYVGLLKARHINWTGYIYPQKSRLIDNKYYSFSILNLRQYLASELAQYISEKKILGIVQALSIGVTSYIDKSDWELFRRTGTIHLMVISGAHIGLVAGIIYSLFLRLWSMSSYLCLRFPAQKAASIMGLMAAFFYSLLSGFAVPAERALIVCFFMFIRNFVGKRFSIWQAWRYALLIVILTEPHSVMSSGFYLSFIAVAVLIIASQRFNYKGIKQTLVLQLSCLLGLMPLTLYWFSYGATNGLIANLIAIPLVGFIIVPLVLLLTISVTIIKIPWLLEVTQFLINILLQLLNWIDSLTLFNLKATLISAFVPIALMLCLALFVCLPIRGLVFTAFFSAILVLFPSYPKPKFGEVEVHMIDVGQGLAVVINTHNHTLVYDTGAKFYRGSDMGQLALIPYFKHMGIKSLDKIVISHPDIDHRGGLKSLQANLPIRELIVDSPEWYNEGTSCEDYPPWVWDGVSFRFMNTGQIMAKRNNRSCVLQVKTHQSSVLLTGDIEKLAEELLVARFGNQLQSAVLLIPHHASKTSSSEEFIEHVNPQKAIVSYGFDNMYHFPHKEALLQYQKFNIPIYNTVDCGMISFTLKDFYKDVEIHCYKNNFV